MKLQGRYIDELIEYRKRAREERNWKLADRIRNYLDRKHSFVIDTEQGQVVYHEPGSTRKQLILKLRREARAEKLFESWLYATKASFSR